jgi:AraC-like DNA-binding protein
MELSRGARVVELARRLGYGSEAACNRAFRRVVGVPPATVRGRPDPPAGPADVTPLP